MALRLNFAMQNFAQGHSPWLADIRRVKMVYHERAPKARVEWWRCRESNPGPTCGAAACTVVLFSYSQPFREEQRKSARDDAWLTASPRHQTVTLPRWLRPISLARIQSETCSHRANLGDCKGGREIRERLLEDRRYICSGRYCLQQWVREPLPSRTEAKLHQYHAVETCHPHDANDQ